MANNTRTENSGCPYILQFWGQSRERTAIIVPAFTPQEAVDMVAHGHRPISKHSHIDRADYSVNFTGDAYARDFVSACLQRIYSDSEKIFSLPSRTIMLKSPKERQEFLSKCNVVLIGSPRSNEVTELAIDLLSRDEFEVSDRFPDARVESILVQPLLRLTEASERHVTPRVRELTGRPVEWLCDYGYVGRFQNPWSMCIHGRGATDFSLTILAGSGCFGTQAAAAAVTIEPLVKQLCLNAREASIRGIVHISHEESPNLDSPDYLDDTRFQPLTHSGEHFQVTLVEPVNAGPFKNTEHVSKSLDNLHVAQLKQRLWKSEYVRHLRARRKSDRKGLELYSLLTVLLLIWSLLAFLDFMTPFLPYQMQRLAELVPWPISFALSLLTMREIHRYAMFCRASTLGRNGLGEGDGAQRD